jgi:hypothetical protein
VKNFVSHLKMKFSYLIILELLISKKQKMVLVKLRMKHNICYGRDFLSLLFPRRVYNSGSCITNALSLWPPWSFQLKRSP